jgi:hypothetical protein
MRRTVRRFRRTEKRKLELREVWGWGYTRRIELGKRKKGKGKERGKEIDLVGGEEAMREGTEEGG